MDPNELEIRDEAEITTGSNVVVQQATESVPQLHNVNASTAFSEVVEGAKINVIKDAAAHDDKFNSDVRKDLTEAVRKSAELEREKQELEKQNVQYASELLATRQELNKQQQASNKWENRQKCREYHYKGVQPIMEFVGIKTPMNLFFLYLLTIVLLPFFLVAKLFRGTFGVMIAGACDEDRSKSAKGALWTMIVILFVGLLALATYLILGWLGIIQIPLFTK